MKSYVWGLTAKKESLVPTPAERNVQIAEASLKLQQLSLKEQQEVRAEKAQKEAEENRVLPETEANLVLGECSVLGDILRGCSYIMSAILDPSGTPSPPHVSECQHLGNPPPCQRHQWSHTKK